MSSGNKLTIINMKIVVTNTNLLLFSLRLKNEFTPKMVPKTYNGILSLEDAVPA